MAYSISRRLAALAVLVAGVLHAPAGTSFAQSYDDAVAAREAAHQRHIASGVTSPAVVVDGTPRPLPGAAPSRSQFDKVTSGARDDAARERTVTSLSSITSEPGMADPLGGDDVVIAASSDFDSRAYLQIASDGTHFVAVIALGDLYVYRSTDNGENWTLWSTFSDPAGDFSSGTDRGFLVAEGDADRALFTYTLAGNAYVAYANIAAPVPSWTIVTAMTDPDVFYSSVRFATDAASFASYYVYVVAEGVSGGRRHIYFARSLDQGSSYENDYRIVESLGTGDQNYRLAHISYGAGFYLHVAFRSETIGDAANAGVRYLRASLFANGGIGSWESVQTLVASTPGANSAVYGMSASVADGGVYLLLTTAAPSPQHYVYYSTDQGATWPAPNLLLMPAGAGRAPLVVPGGDLVYAYSDAADFTATDYRHQVLFSRSTAADPSTWSTGERISNGFTTGLTSCNACLEGLESNPTQGNRVAAVWVQLDAAERVIRFDAEWRRDPGYPNTDIGFPVAITGGGQTPPAVAEVDGDPDKEIVFATRTGDIHVVNHNGTPVPGWPVNIGSIPFDAPVAVGDLLGNGIPAIVAGNDVGEVYAFAPDGTLLPGWPVDLTTASPAYVSIGALGPPHPRYVVAVAGNEMRVLRYDGTTVQFWTFTDTFTRPAAIGDVDSDGVTEIVSLKGEWFHVNRLGLGGPEQFRWFPGETFSDAPTLADFDNNGTLETAAPTVDGKMYLLNYDGTDYSVAWPITVSPGVALTSAALGQILGTIEPELVFAETNGNVHVRYLSGTEQTGYPLASGGTITYMPPILSPVNIFVSNVNIGTTNGADGTGQSWRNIPSSAVPGWPRNLPGPVEETFASGDIDNDGRNEIVVLGVNFLSVYDVGEPPATNARNHWPMYAYDAQRTGCLACEDILTGVDDAPPAAGTTSLEAYPNPFNPSTTIEYEVPRAGRVSLEIFDVGGRRVATLIHNEAHDAGRYTLSYTATTASGVYFARLRTGAGEVTRKIVLLK